MAKCGSRFCTRTQNTLFLSGNATRIDVYSKKFKNKKIVAFILIPFPILKSDFIVQLEIFLNTFNFHLDYHTTAYRNVVIMCMDIRFRYLFI